MKKTEDLTLGEMNKVFGVLMDSKLQNQLMQKIEDGDSNGEGVWMLDYVYDSSLRIKLEKCYEVAAMREELLAKNPSKEDKEIKPKL